MPRKLSEATLRETAALVEKLGSQAAAAKDLGVTPLTICLRMKKLRELGLPQPATVRDAPAKPRPLPKKAKKQWDAKEREHWRRYVEGGRSDEALRNTLIDLNLPKLRHLAAKRASEAGSKVSADDLFQEGVIGMIDAARRYKPDAGASFWTFASRRCWGAMADWMRGRDHVPRLERAKVSRGEIDESKIRGLESLERTVYESESGGPTELKSLLLAFGDSPEVAFNFESHFLAITKTLAMDQKVMLWLYVVRQATMKNIGVVMGLSESRISQQIGQAKEWLYRDLEKEDFTC